MKKTILTLTFFLITIYITRAQNGIIDKTFGNNGFITEKADIYLSEVNMLIQEDGKIIITGTVDYSAGNLDIFVIRYNMDGSIDGTKIINVDNKDNHASGLAIESSGKILITGYTWIGSDSYVIRLNRNLTFDNSFGQQGIVRFDFSEKSSDIERIKNIVVYNDGEYYVSGDAKIEGITKDLDQFIFKLTSSGFVDNSFNNGKVLYLGDYGYNNFNKSLLIQGNELIVAGYSKSSDYTYLDLFYIYGNGSLDKYKYFGINTVNGCYANDFIITNNNEIIATGPINRGTSDSDVFVAKFNYEGDIDDNFGHNGLKYYDIFDAKKLDEPFSITQLPNHNYLIAGSKFEEKWSWESSYAFTIIENGEINNSFGENPVYGITNWNLEGSKLDQAIVARYNPVNNMIYIAGKTYGDDDKNLYLTRLTSNVNATRNINDAYGKMIISPNPVRHTAILNFPNSQDGLVSIKIISQTGQTVYKTTKQLSNKIVLNNLNIKSGLYIIKASSKNKEYISKIVVLGNNTEK